MKQEDKYMLTDLLRSWRDQEYEVLRLRCDDRKDPPVIESQRRFTAIITFVESLIP